MNTLSVITALRLCNRSGEGADCYIKKLPTELVERIEHFVLESEREKCLTTWSKELVCWRKECTMYDDHLTPQEQEIFCAQHGCMREGCDDEAHIFGGEGGEPRGHACSGRGKCALAHSLSYEESVISTSKKLYEHTFEAECSDNRASFQRKIEDGFLYSHRHLLKTHFGVDFWTTTTRSTPSFDWADKIALAYLTLSGDFSSLAVVKRFHDALKKLGLEIFIEYGAKPPLSTMFSRPSNHHELLEEDMEIRALRQTMSSAPVKKAGPWPQLIQMS